MSYTDPLLAMSDALYGLLATDSTLVSLAPGGVFFDVPQNPTFPLVYLRVQHDSDRSGFSAKPGRRSRPGVQLRVHVFQSDYGTVRQAQQAMARVVDVLFSNALAVTGYDVFCDGQPLPDITELPFEDEQLNGIKVKELVLTARYLLEEAA